MSPNVKSIVSSPVASIFSPSIKDSICMLTLSPNLDGRSTLENVAERAAITPIVFLMSAALTSDLYSVTLSFFASISLISGNISNVAVNSKSFSTFSKGSCSISGIPATLSLFF